MRNKLTSMRTVNEEGFTLVELVIVCLIIGILAAIAVPIFINQQKSAIASGVRSDVQNTNLTIATKLGVDPTSALVGGHNAVRLTKDNPFFYVGTPENGLTPVTSGSAVEAENANTRAVISDANTVLEVYGYWNNYVIDAHNTGLTSQDHNYYSYRSNTGKAVGTGDLS